MRFLHLCFALLACLAGTLAQAQSGVFGAGDAELRGVPALKGRVIDETGAISATERDALDAKLGSIEKLRGAQIVILMVKSTQPEPIADYAHRVADSWKLGRKREGDGVLIVVAKEDKRVRIEVSRALEGAIPDALASRIIREEMGQRFAKGDFNAGLNGAVDNLSRAIGAGTQAASGTARPGVPDVVTNQFKNKSSNPVAGHEEWLLMGLFGLFAGGMLLTAIFGRVFGSLLVGVGGGALAWLIAASTLVAILVGVLAFVFWLVFSALRGRGFANGGGYGDYNSGGGFGSSSGGGGGSVFSSGGGGDFAGGGASGSWGDD